MSTDGCGLCVLAPWIHNCPVSIVSRRAWGKRSSACQQMRLSAEHDYWIMKSRYAVFLNSLIHTQCVNSLRPSDAYMLTHIYCLGLNVLNTHWPLVSEKLVNIVSGESFLPDVTKPLHEAILPSSL